MTKKNPHSPLSPSSAGQEKAGGSPVPRKKNEPSLRDGGSAGDLDTPFIKAVFSSMQDGLSVLDPSGVHIDVNPALCRMTGFSRDELIGTAPPHPYWHPDAHDEIRQAFEKTLNGEPGPFELRFIKKDTTPLKVLISPSPVHDAGGQVIAYMATVKDITAQKHAEGYHRILSRIADEAPVSVTVHDFDGNFLYANEETFRLHGFPYEEFMKKNLHDIDVPESEHLIANRMEQIRNRGEADFDVQHYRKDGSVFPLHVNAKVVDWGGRWVLLSIATDLSERQRADRLLKESEERFRKVFENSPMGMVLVSKDFRFVLVNPAWIAMTGYSESELLKLSFKDITHPDHLSGDMEHMQELIAGRIPVYQTEKRYIRKDGSILWGFIRVTIIRDPQGTFRNFAAQIEDITERKQAEDALRESEEKYHSLYRNSAIGIFHSGFDGRFIDVNPSLAKMLGYNSSKEAITSITSIAEQVYFEPPRYNTVTTTALDKGEIIGVENRYRRRDGTLWYGMLHVRIVPDQQGKPSHYEGFVEDITERKRVEDALRESEEKNRTLVSSVDAGIILQSDSGRILTWNPAAERVFGVSAENVLEHTSSDIKWRCFREDGSPFPAEEHPSMITMSTGKPLRDVIMGVTSSTGRFSWISINTTPLFHDGESTPHAVVISFSDITERKAGEDALRESEKVLADIIEKNPLSIQIVDSVGFTLKVNPAHTLLFGSVPPPDFSIFADLQRKQPALEDLIRRARSGEVVHLPDLSFNAHDVYPEYPDVPVWVRAIIFPLNDKYGKPERFVFMHENITGRKKADEALQQRTDELENRNRLISTLLDTVPMGIFMVESPSGRPMIANAAATRLLGRGVLPAANETNLAEVYEAYRTGTPDRYPASEMPIVRGMQGESSHIDDMEVVRPDGTRTLLEIFGNPVFDRQDHIAASLVSFLDITDRKRAEDIVKDLNLYNRNLIEINIDPLVTISPEGKIQDVNIATETATGLTRDALIGSDFSEYFTEPEKAREGYLRVLSEGNVVDYPLEIRHIDGNILPVLYNATVYRDGSGTIKGVFAAARDITERKRAEEQQETLIRELAQKNAELDRFTHTVSHDLKSPLITIRGFVGLLEEDIQKADPAQVQEDLNRISSAAEKMERLIITLLELSRSGRTVDAPVRIPFTDLAREAAGLLASSLNEHHVTIAITDNLPEISGDRVRLLQVMTNLLDNATKFMGEQKEPRIEVGVRDEAGTPVFFVRDNGMGIKKENLSKVFALFERFNPEVPGTGIGLATVKRIIEAHGGRIRVESEGEGKGTTVCFTVPGAECRSGCSEQQEQKSAL